ncbi:MAG: metal-dependent hydrolase [Planctomycetales bacterium]|nr:metal-dependent hydrolase [Planctomycetales bacterium]NIM08413.1 metal-dependent hydrolase [Planctomycetales bacterium]NIN07888.1 metal-dependent hydrolase [Planctomycetales bacterium]NIN77018.1 metal-dependent hydrolase [Planctomycetales bacterium]NIO34201.1 metal-dependent hydrolase [Planctomycetales bacterium]
MYYFDPHIHMVSRVTDDYETLAKMGCIGVSEPAFWAGYDRGSAEGFRDYFRQLTEFEPTRASWYGIQHYTWLCINAKEAENVTLAREVIAMIPEFLDRPGVLGIGEIGLNKNSKNEATIFLEHLDLAAETDQQILIHTPHLEDKYQGTRMILDMLCHDRRIDRGRVCVDHVEEHTARMVIENGFWAGMTLYPVSKCTAERAVDLVEMYGPERFLVNSAGDWGPSRPTAVPDFILAMRRRGHPEQLIRRVVYENPLQFFRQSRNFAFTSPESRESAAH